MKEPFVLIDDQYMLIDSWRQKNLQLVAGFTTKNGGVSSGDFQSLNTGFHVGDRLEDVQGNRGILAEKLSFSLDGWIGAEQTHETQILQVTSLDGGRGSTDYISAFKATDGFYSKDRNVLLTMCYADCVPLYFLAPAHGMIGVAHAGWKGSVNGIARKMVEAWLREGIKEAEIFAVIGPSICSKCYVVDDKVIDLVQNLLEDNDEKPYNLISEGQYQLDLKQLNGLVLQKAGIPISQIDMTSYCTSCDHDLFFSHRRDNGKTGRLMSFIGWKEDLG
ncbi:laccase [Peribacillus muralis]|uniref:Purine nucleoside phosphorylase n=1 Tax=Peribacillus muralis TaxID=264697 RepID=A0A1B3XLW7_9BACI|nr:peptidoglycan editing factor PgeF [Peribacillus muralis]AOH54207.1 laccase [Peribacillus muralis]